MKKVIIIIIIIFIIITGAWAFTKFVIGGEEETAVCDKEVAGEVVPEDPEIVEPCT